ncbi:MAG: helix-turn-helix transcriptional regulator, partial [Dehalococcoidia bacterium]|nr:helix-turn-helix transcriptional regulator [Dehalococcoidia bacterium]
MTSAQVEHFAAAEAHEHELNERQRRVLDLLVQGKTNGEVAGALGITLDGAKWNVSEILGKLGLATREEAADYWRWRNRHGRGVVRALRGLAGPAALKWAAGGVAAVAVAAIAVGFFANQDSEPAAPGEFYLEARVEVVDRSRTVGTNIAGATPAADDAEITVSTLRWWSKDRDHARWEVHRQADGGPTVVTTIVV